MPDLKVQSTFASSAARCQGPELIIRSLTFPPRLCCLVFFAFLLRQADSLGQPRSPRHCPKLLPHNSLSSHRKRVLHSPKFQGGHWSAGRSCMPIPEPAGEANGMRASHWWIWVMSHPWSEGEEPAASHSRSWSLFCPGRTRTGTRRGSGGKLVEPRLPSLCNGPNQTPGFTPLPCTSPP